MKPERIMKMGTKRFKPMDTLKIRVVTRAPRTNSPVGKMEYETQKADQWFPELEGGGGGVDGWIVTVQWAQGFLLGR